MKIISKKMRRDFAVAAATLVKEHDSHDWGVFFDHHDGTFECHSKAYADEVNRTCDHDRLILVMSGNTGYDAEEATFQEFVDFFSRDEETLRLLESAL